MASSSSFLGERSTFVNRLPELRQAARRQGTFVLRNDILDDAAGGSGMVAVATAQLGGTSVQDVAFVPDQTEQSLAQMVQDNPSAEAQELKDRNATLERFGAKAAEVQTLLSRAKNRIDGMTALKRELVSSTSDAKIGNVQERFQETVGRCGDLLQKAKTDIQDLKEGISNASSSSSSPPVLVAGMAEERIMSQMAQQLLVRLRQHVLDFQQIQGDFFAEIQSKKDRQLTLVFGAAKAAELRDLDDLRVRSEIRRLAQGSSSQRSELEALDQKYEAMRGLETRIREVHQLFTELNLLVDQQGELLDHIEYSVVNAKNYTYQTEKQLIAGRKKQRQRQLCCVCVTSVIVIVVLVAVIIAVIQGVIAKR